MPPPPAATAPPNPAAQANAARSAAARPAIAIGSNTPSPSGPAPVAPAAPAARAPAPRTAPAPAPAKPAAAAPAAPATPAPGAPGGPPPHMENTSQFDEAFNQFQKGLSPNSPAPPEARANTPPPAEPQEIPHDPALGEEEPALDPAKPIDPKPTQEEPRVGADGKRKNPWQLVDNYRRRNQELQVEVADLRTKQGGNGELPGEVKATLETLQKRNAELENEIGFFNFRKSKEFVENYEKPFKTAWEEAVIALGGLKVSFKTGQMDEEGKPTFHQRDLTSQDIQHLVNMEPTAARLEMKQRFPEDFSEVKQHVDKMRSLANAQKAKEQEYRENGAQWEKNRQEQQMAAHRAMAETNSQLWKELNQEALTKHDILRPVEGDEAHNEALAKSTAFVDEAMGLKPGDPSLSPEQRRVIVKKVVALRNRAIAYGILNQKNKALASRVAELEKNLADFQGSQPGGGEGRRSEAGLPREADTLDGAFAEMDRYAQRR